MIGSMRGAVVVAMSWLLACSSTPPSLPSGDGPNGGSSGGTDGGQTEGTSDAATSDAATSGPVTTSVSDTSTAGAMACVPGMSIACFCPSGFAGAQSCNPEGTGYEPCQCSGEETGGSTGGAACDMPADCQSCSYCAQRNDCATQTTACFDDPECVAVVECANACTDQTCFDACLADGDGSGPDLYLALINCIVDSCPACNGGG